LDAPIVNSFHKSKAVVRQSPDPPYNPTLVADDVSGDRRNLSTDTHRLRRLFLILLTTLSLSVACNPVTPVMHFIAKIEEQGDKSQGITYYVGGAGPIGNVGSWDVPQGLVDGGYPGYVEIYSWQGITHAGDQMDLSGNRTKGADLADEIKRYRRFYPNQKINIIALSAGTGIATFALERLGENVKVDNVVFLGCSMSSEYDMTRALNRVGRGVYVMYSENDELLKNVVTYTGTVDRRSADEGIAGLVGFRRPSGARSDTDRMYRKLHNIPYRIEFMDAGYKGGHTDSTNRLFVAEYVAPVFMGKPEKLLGVPPPRKRPSAPVRADVSKPRPRH
jgi:pimeloyl-ACP methyl ester carboxylesterase